MGGGGGIHVKKVGGGGGIHVKKVGGGGGILKSLNYILCHNTSDKQK